MDGKFLDPEDRLRREAAVRRGRIRRRRLCLELVLGDTVFGALWFFGWIHPVPAACLLAMLTGRTCYRLGKEDGYGY